MKEVKNTAVLALVSYNEAENLTNENIQFTIATFVNENGSFELPYCSVDGEGDIKQQLLDSFYNIADIDGLKLITPKQLKTCSSYSSEHENYVEVTSAYMIFLDGKPAIRKIAGEKTPAWMNIDVFEHQALFKDQNEIINVIKEKLLEFAITPSSDIDLGERAKAAIIGKYFPKDEKIRQNWVQRFQKSESGFNVYEYIHPGVAIDLLIFGYKNLDEKKGGKKENSAEISILLTKRKNAETPTVNDTDFLDGSWSLPGGFLLENEEITIDDTDGKEHKLRTIETINEAAIRIVKEKIGYTENGQSIINEDTLLYNLKPFIHHSRMNWTWRDGSQVITLPVFIPINYSDVNSKQSLTTSSCKWFPIKRVLWTDNNKTELLRGDKRQKLNADGSLSTISKTSDDNVSIYNWKKDDCNFFVNYNWSENQNVNKNILRSPEEIGLPAADVYIRDEKLYIDYYHSIVKPHRPIQDMNFDNINKRPSLPLGTELMTADHANILLCALQEISRNTYQTLHIVSKLLNGAIISTSDVTRMFETLFFPWAFSLSSMHKKLVVTNKWMINVDTDKERSHKYRFANDEELDASFQEIKPLF